MLNDLDQLMEEREIELNRPIIDIEKQLKSAKTSFASLDNKSAIESLLLIVNSNTDQRNIWQKHITFLVELISWRMR